LAEVTSTCRQASIDATRCHKKGKFLEVRIQYFVYEGLVDFALSQLTVSIR
jgi:hypothetical protein